MSFLMGLPSLNPLSQAPVPSLCWEAPSSHWQGMEATSSVLGALLKEHQTAGTLGSRALGCGGGDGIQAHTLPGSLWASPGPGQ